ncbi:hypothetical protein CapIbe_000595 [Capra ibex]
MWRAVSQCGQASLLHHQQAERSEPAPHLLVPLSSGSLPTVRRAGMQPQKSNRNHPLRHDNDSRCSKQAWSAPLQGALPPCASKELKERLTISLPFVRRE